MSYVSQSLDFDCERFGGAWTCLCSQLAASKAGIIFKRSWIEKENLYQSWNQKMLVKPWYL